ncbi:Glycoside hydrolase family 18 protein [Mycena venus]|uniref:Glycoside hydrolase family 18 protein n=1 Tax=Mycena venus TaxID=2733690 RepID=A0A8H7D2R0_9AGAR|nr:Glycoside hydrolase family 18 protein [Mycena venus]
MDIVQRLGSTIKARYAAAGIKLLVSAFGSSDVSTSSGVNPNVMATTMANWVVQFDLTGIDVDYEMERRRRGSSALQLNFAPSFLKASISSLMLVRILYLCDNILGTERCPSAVTPWFSRINGEVGGYLKVHQSVGNLIDWFKVQFYDQGT